MRIPDLSFFTISWSNLYLVSISRRLSPLQVSLLNQINPEAVEVEVLRLKDDGELIVALGGAR